MNELEDAMIEQAIQGHASTREAMRWLLSVHSTRVGEFLLSNPAPGKVAIYTDSGEGGHFDEAAFEAHVARFYDEHF